MIAKSTFGKAGRSVWMRGAFFAALFVSLPAAVSAQADFYAGKRITIAVGATPGGGYDIYARAIAPFIGEHIPGKPNVVVQNMPGAGSLTSVLYLDSTAPRDGTAITIFNAGVITDTVTNPGGAKVDLTKMAWIGSANRSFRICYYWHGSGIRSFSDLNRAKTVTMGAIGAGSGSYNDVAILKNLMQQNVRGILGYPGRTEVHLAIERGELDGECGTVEGIPEHWIRDKRINVILRMSNSPTPGIPDGVPWIGDFIKSPDALQVLNLLTVANELGRPFVMSRQVPADRIEIIRTAFEATMKDENFVATAEKRKLALNYVNGRQAQDMIARLGEASNALRERARDIVK